MENSVLDSIDEASESSGWVNIEGYRVERKLRHVHELKHNINEIQSKLQNEEIKRRIIEPQQHNHRLDGDDEAREEYVPVAAPVPHDRIVGDDDGERQRIKNRNDGANRLTCLRRWIRMVALDARHDEGEAIL